MTEVVEMLDSGKELVVCWQCSLADRSGRLNKMGIEHRKSHRARDTRQDRADRFRRRLKELRAEQVESYQRMPPKRLPRFGQILWDLQILAERAIRFFRGIRTKPRAFTALQRVKASIGR